jgi:hypothetical protein
MMPQRLRDAPPDARRRVMRPRIRVFSGVALFVGIAGCTATGSTTIVGQPGTGAEGGVVDMNDGGSSATSPQLDYEALFGPPTSSSVTPDSINGLWAGSSSQFPDIRLKLSGTTLILAQHCSSGTAGLSAAARISASEIAILESKNTNVDNAPGPAGCGFDVRPVDIARCMATTATAAESEGIASDSGCFFLSGTKLNFYGGSFLFDGKLTKLSD